MKKFFALLLIAFMVVALCSSGCKQKFVSLNFAVELNDHAAAAYIARSKGDFKKYGIKVSSFNQYATGMALAAALSRGDINIGYICVVPAIIAYSRGVPIKIVSLTHQYGYELVVPKSINNINELSGKLIACPGEGSAANFVMKLTEEKYNVNFRILRTKPLMEIDAMKKGSVSGAFIPEHYASILVFKGFKILLKSQDIMKDMPGSCVVVKDNVIKQNPALVSNLISLTKEETVFINSHRTESARIIASYLHCPENIVKYSMNNLEYTTNIDTDKIQYVIDKLAQFGYIKKFSAKDIIWQGK